MARSRARAHNGVVPSKDHPSRSARSSRIYWHRVAHQKSDTLPLKLQSPSCSIQRRTGSRFGPPRSPVAGLTSPSKSALSGTGASGCLSARPAGAFATAATSACRWSASNSRCCAGGRGCGAGRRPRGGFDAMERETRRGWEWKVRGRRRWTANMLARR